MKFKLTNQSIKAAVSATTNLVLSNKTTRLISDATGNILKMAIVIGRFIVRFKFDEDTAAVSENN